MIRRWTVNGAMAAAVRDWMRSLRPSPVTAADRIRQAAVAALRSVTDGEPVEMVVWAAAHGRLWAAARILHNAAARASWLPGGGRTA